MDGVWAKRLRKSRLRVAGLMSGTSADGVDAAIVDITPAGRVRVVAFATFPYPPALRRRILDIAHADTARVDDLCHLNFALGEVFADALVRLARRSRIALRSIDLVGSHGQTVRHLPKRRRGGATLQLAEPSVIAERTGILTVADFRPRDVAAGGEGAPLVPYADWLLFRDRRKARAVQNIGGIANVTFLPGGTFRVPRASLAKLIAFDTGPGNMVIDRAAERASRGRARYDAGGRLAARGRVDAALLGELMRHPYLARRPPKSTGRETFGRAFADTLYDRARRRGMRPADIVATVTAWTAEAIADAYRRFLPRTPDEVILSGGGTRNATLLARLAEAVAPARVQLSDAFGIDADAKEAVSFAILAWATVRGQANNVPSATGAERAVVLGKIVPGSDVPRIRPKRTGLIRGR
jgi:anhydro-N-acetylmuramic acid kinase